MLDLGQMKDPDANDEHIVNIVDWLLGYAFAQRASDIHIEPRRDIGRVRFRIDGVLHTIYEFPAQVTTAVVSRIKILGRLDVAEKRRPQDGRLKTRRADAIIIGTTNRFGEGVKLHLIFFNIGRVDDDSPNLLTRDMAKILLPNIHHWLRRGDHNFIAIHRQR